MDLNDEDQEDNIWTIVGVVIGVVLFTGLAIGFCLIWSMLNPKDSLDDLGDAPTETNLAARSQGLRQWRRGKPAVVGVKSPSSPIRQSGLSGYKWKKKWRDRKARSKERRKQKHEARKKRRAEKAKQEEEEQDSSSEVSSEEGSGSSDES